MSSDQAKKYHSITIGNKNTWDDWHLVPTSRPLVAPPNVNTSYIAIPGSDGSLDLTEALTGYPTYANRTGSWEFIVMNDYGSWESRYSEIMGYLHGKKMKAVLDDDPRYYYEGRFSVSSWVSQKDWSRITINYILDPFKTEINGSDEEWLWDTFNFDTDTIEDYRNIQVSGYTTFVVENDTMPVYPIINASNDMSVAFNGTTYALKAGDNAIRGIRFREGSNTLIFTGNGTVTIKMHGGRF